MRGLGREKYASSPSTEWRCINLKPKNNVYEKKILFKVLRKAISAITPYENIWRYRETIKNANCIYVVKYPTVTQFRILKFLNNHLILDFDDPIWLPEFLGLRRFKKMLQLSEGFTCDNILQLNVAKKFNNYGIAASGIIPEIDKKISHSKKRIIWIGSNSTRKYLEIIKSELEYVLKFNQNLTLKLLGVEDLSFIPEIEVEYISEYSEKDMISNLKISDIGIFPFFEDELGFARGLHKARIYAAAGIPVVATNSPLFQSSGINQNLLFLCNNKKDWVEHLTFLATENFLNNQGNRYDANWNNTDSTERVLNFIKSRTAEA